MTHSGRRTIIRPFLLAALVTLMSAALVRPNEAQSLRPALHPQVDSDFVILELHNTIVSPSDTTYALSVYLTNTATLVAGFQIQINLNRPDLVQFPGDSTDIDTSVFCQDSATCDTTIDTFMNVAPIDLEGSAIADWGALWTNSLSPTLFRCAALADWIGSSGGSPLPATGEPHFLFDIILKRVASSSMLDTLQDRSVMTFINPFPWTNFTDTNAAHIGTRDSVYCVNPPACDTLDTVRVVDNVYVNARLTIGISCATGDTNDDGSITSADIIYLVNYVFKGGPAPICSVSIGNVDCSGFVTSADIIYLVNFVFKGGAGPCTSSP